MFSALQFQGQAFLWWEAGKYGPEVPVTGWVNWSNVHVQCWKAHLPTVTLIVTYLSEIG